MGVPKFFRYTSERYPCLNELVKQYQIPDFDNMYLDMNGIIHNCSHPDDSNPHFRITEEKIFRDIFHYICMLFQIIKPKKLFFMAIDGVAPRAKMNQQRGRRFRSAREAENLEEKAKAKGEVLPSEKRFDSNCITPGTVFMVRLHEQLKYFIKEKMSTDPLWSKVRVILSGHETPGEGEHKIMDYIRWARSQPDYNPNTRHCLYGLDADLIMLGMCTHEPHFALLREEVKFGKSTQRATSPEETNFYLLHLTLLREYLEQEFISIKDKLNFPFDIEKIVDDWVLMGFLVGNDFIPNLPNMHVSNDALPLLYKAYMKVLPQLDGYINEGGDLNLERFETFMQELAKIDKEKFQDTYVDLKYFEGKTGRRPNAQERKEYKPNNDDTFNVNIDDIKANKPDDELQALIDATQDMYMEDLDIDDPEEYEETSDEEMNFETEFLLHKKDYYMNKLDYTKVTEEVLADQAEGYVRAIQWNLSYYYKGCPSWCWYYPHHYAPYMSDIKGFKNLKIEFELGEPFKPFEQLLAVLPAASKHLLPAPFHDLMTDEDSPIVHYYPINFETDLNGKKNDWEAVVLIPFIDEVNLLSAMAPCYQRLTEEEKNRNKHGPMLIYDWTPKSQGTVLAPDYFSPIINCHALEKKVLRQELDVPIGQLKRGMLPNAQRDMLFPGFPTMRHLKYKTSLQKCKVKVFDQPSRNENMIVHIIREVDTEPPLEQVAEELLGKVIWVGWPHLTKAKVISVSNEKMRLHHIEQQDKNKMKNNSVYKTEANEGNLHQQWLSERSTIVEHNKNRLGIELGDVGTIVHAVSLKGFKYIIQDDSKLVMEELWCNVACGYAYQAVVKDVKAYIMQCAGRFSTPQEAYPPGDHVFLLTKGQYYACLATVMDSESIRSGRIKVQVVETAEPVPVVQPGSTPYRSAYHAAAACGISPQMMSRITGTVLVVAGKRNDLPTDTQTKFNVGLNLKFNKKNQEVSGFTRRCKLSNAWLYSERCINLITEYAKQFPELFDKLGYTLNNDIYFEGDLWPSEIGQGKPQEIMQWLKSQPHHSAPRRECGSESLEPEELKTLSKSIDEQMSELKNREKKVTLHVRWNLLYKPELHEGNVPPDPQAPFKMYDRVVCVARNITVPLGTKGTITAIYQPPTSNTVRLSDKLNVEPSYQVLFDQTFPGAMTEDLFDEPRLYRMLPTNMMNISYGRNLTNPMNKPLKVQNNFVFNRSPNVLRRDDGHHSAFASYSPTSENKLPFEKLNNSTPKTPSSTTDNPTEFLKNLLNISQNSEPSPKNNTQKSPSVNTNWRIKTDHPPVNVVSQHVPQSPKSQGPLNWRSDSKSNNRFQQPQIPQMANEQNRNFQNPPIPPFQVPFPSQMPFNQIQTPPVQQQRAHNAGYHNNQNLRAPPVQPPIFPKHLPTVTEANVTLAPSWSQSQTSTTNKPSNSNHNDLKKTKNPFVPLQVQTRRIQSSSGSSGNRITQKQQSIPNNESQKPQSLAPLVPQQESVKQQKKKKPRIAANLPFKMD